MIIVSLMLVMQAAAAPNSSGYLAPLEKRSVRMTYSSKRFAIAAERFGQCVAKKDSYAAEEYVLDPDAAQKPRQQDIYGRILKTNCAGSDGTMTFSDIAIRYPLAIGLVRQDRSIQFSELKLTSALDHAAYNLTDDFKSNPKKYTQQNYQEAVRFSELGECIVREDSSNSLDFILSAAGSRQEKDALARLEKAVTTFGDSGVPMQISSFNLKGSLAVNFYRLTRSTSRKQSVSATRQASVQHA